MLASCGGANGGKTGDEGGGAEGHGGERKKREDCAETKKAGFLADFGPDFLLPQAMKSTSIYRRWKRVFSSIPV
jgi:hypothetical protein